MSHKPVKNIDSTLHDIRQPAVRLKVERSESVSRRTSKKHTINYKKLLVVAVILVVSSGGYGLYASGVVPNLVNALTSDMFHGSIGDVEAVISSPKILRQFPSLFGNIREVIGALHEIGTGVGELNSRGLALVFSGGGEEFLGILKRIHSNIGTLVNLDIDIPDALSPPSSISSIGSTDALGDINNLYMGLGAVINFLDTPNERRIIFLFQNHSEIRPTGGFIGSYAEVIVNRGSVEDIKVDDIYTPDRHSTYKVVPPEQLQSITTGWGARDANWFFDYPTSAEKVLEFIEASDLYAHDGVKFDGAIAINSKVVADILNIVGPIELPEYGVTLNADNFMFTVRDQIEEARDENPKENPKQILGAVAPIIIERLRDADSEKKRQLILDVLSRAMNKDIQDRKSVV